MANESLLWHHINSEILEFLISHFMLSISAVLRDFYDCNAMSPHQKPDIVCISLDLICVYFSILFLIYCLASFALIALCQENHKVNVDM